MIALTAKVVPQKGTEVHVGEIFDLQVIISNKENIGPWQVWAWVYSTEYTVPVKPDGMKFLDPQGEEYNAIPLLLDSWGTMTTTPGPSMPANLYAGSYLEGRVRMLAIKESMPPLSLLWVQGKAGPVHVSPPPTPPEAISISYVATLDPKAIASGYSINRVETVPCTILPTTDD